MVHFIPTCQRKLVFLAAQADSAPALICGATGSGKSAVARWIHRNGSRALQVFQVARHDRPLADQILESRTGTLLVPEIGEWNLSDQMLLLHFLKTKSIQTQDLTTLCNTRIIVTTSQSLEGRAQGGLFNAELLEKLNVFRIEMPSLAKRKEDFEEIVSGILREITREIHKEHLTELTPEAWTRLKQYEWPGNLRELRNVLRMAVLSSKKDKIDVADLPNFGYTKVDFHATREQFEKIYILELLKTFDWEIEKTCKMTKMDRSILLSKIKHYGIAVER